MAAETSSTTREQAQTELGTLESESFSQEKKTVFHSEASTNTSNERTHCGPHCANVTDLHSVEAKRSSWSFVLHQDQEKVLQYVLDTSRPGNELIVRTDKTCLTRSDFQTLGLMRWMESTIGNACFELIKNIALSKDTPFVSMFIQGKTVYVVDLYICPTWLPPANTDPMTSLPTCVRQMDAIVIPLWTPGHFQLSVMKPAQKEILFLDSLNAGTESQIRGQQYMPILRDVAQKLYPGSWTERWGKDLEAFPTQDFGSDCGIFMLMSALYVVLEAKFDYSVHDMPILRRWWCLLLLENHYLNSHGKLFAHWTDECRELLEGKHAPVFHLKRRMQQDTEGNTKKAALEKDFDNKVCMADPMKFCLFQTSENTGLRLLYPDVDNLQWLQCHVCNGWLHTECAGTTQVPFQCGCSDLCGRPRNVEALSISGIVSKLSKKQIKTLYDDLISGKQRSNRLFLWQNPSASLALKQHLKLRTLNLTDQRIFELLKTIEEVTGLGSRVKKGELRLLDFVFDVMLPEILISILQEEGLSRLEAEIMMASGNN